MTFENETREFYKLKKDNNLIFFPIFTFFFIF